MTTFIFNGEQETVFPTIAVTVNTGDSFEAPDDFVAENVSVAKGKKAAAVVEQAVVETAPAIIEVTPVEEGTN